MNSMIYNPLEEYEQKFKATHLELTKKKFSELVSASGVDAEENRRTLNEHQKLRDRYTKLKTKLNWMRFFRVILIITLIMIPLVILKITPKIRSMRAELQSVNGSADELLMKAKEQMAPLCALFTDKQSLSLIEATLPSLSFADIFSEDMASNMRINFGFEESSDPDGSALSLLSGEYNGNPFLFEENLIHTVGTQIYHGYKVISWTETYRGSDGKLHTRRRSQTLHASVTKPKPYFEKRISLNYCAAGGDDLSFTRDASHLHRLDDKEAERYVKKGEKKLDRLTEDAIKRNDDFISMSNSKFEVFFDALDRTNEVQYRTLFTPLAQTNMVDLIRSKAGYGDDFTFIKKNRVNRIITDHSRSRDLRLTADGYVSASYDEIESKFINKNSEFFKAVYFDFAPLLAIPIYQESPVHSLEPIPDPVKKYSYTEYEVLANMMPEKHTVHPLSKTRAILKTDYLSTKDGVDEIEISALSYDIFRRVDYVSVFGGDGRFHAVPVWWDEYSPLESKGRFFVAHIDAAKNESFIAQSGKLCIYN